MLPARRQWIVPLLHDWGFNTAGCWSSPSVWPDFYVAEQIYVDFRPHAHDVFDAAFWQGPFADHLREEVKPFRGQPNVLGYFLDNEPAWNAPHMFAFYLRLGKHTPGSRALLAYLQTYYQGRISPPESGVGHRVSELCPDPRDPAIPTVLAAHAARHCTGLAHQGRGDVLPALRRHGPRP